MSRQQIPNVAGLALIVFFVAFPFVYAGRDYDYIMHILITGFFYAILAASWSMLSGYAGQFSFGHMGFMGVGAYTTALFCHYFYLSPEPTNLCTEYPFGDQYLIIVNPIGVTSSTLTQDCLRQALAMWDGTVQVTPMPIWLGIVLGTLMGVASEGLTVAQAGSGGQWVHTELYSLVQAGILRRRQPPAP